MSKSPRGGWATVPILTKETDGVGVGTQLWWFVSGYWLDGEPLTDATFFRQATTPLMRGQRALKRWHWLPGWQRAATRLGVTMPVLLVLVMYAEAPAALASTLRALLWLSLPVVATAVAIKVKRRSHVRDYERAVIAWYADKFSMLTHQVRSSDVSIPQGHRSETKPVTITYPLGYAPRPTEQLADAERLAHLLRLTDPDWHFTTLLGRTAMIMSLVPKPPTVVPLERFHDHARRHGR